MTKKNGIKSGRQLYKCQKCKRQFVGGKRINQEELWIDYTQGKQNYAQLSDKYGCCKRTIQRYLDKVHPTRIHEFDSVANVLMDTTYFGRKLGVMVFKDSISGKILLKYYVKHETNNLYFQGIQEIRRRGIYIQSIICDGRKGLLQLFDEIPTQMCQFHQIQIVTRYLTRKPKTPASIELKFIVLKLTKLSKIDFELLLDEWHLKWYEYLKERSVSSKTEKTTYTHKKLRSAYLSLRRNIKWLFTFEDYQELMIPNTTNALDGVFSDLKNKLRNHNGLNIERKKKFIDGFFKA